MTDLNQAVKTQLENIQDRTGKSLEELEEFIKNRGLEKFGQVRNMLKEELGMGQYTVRLSSLDEVDKQLISWFKAAYESAG